MVCIFSSSDSNQPSVSQLTAVVNAKDVIIFILCLLLHKLPSSMYCGKERTFVIFLFSY